MATPPLAPTRTNPDWTIQGKLNDLAKQYPNAPTEELVNYAKNEIGYNPVDDQVYNLFYNYRKEPQQVAPLAQLMQPAAAPTAPAAPTSGITPEQAKAFAASGGNLADFMALSGRADSTAQEDVRGSLGIDQLASEVYSPPKKSTQQLYEDAYASAGLSDVRSRISELDSTITKKQQELTDKVNEVNDNPWLSEASRVGKLARLRSYAESTIGNLLDSRNQLSTEYDRGVSSVNNVVTRQTQDFSTNQQLNSQKLQYLLGEAERKIGLLGQEGQTAALGNLDAFAEGLKSTTGKKVFGSAASGYGYLDPDGNYIELIPATPKTIGSAARGFSQYNTETGEWESVIPGSGVGGGGKKKPAASETTTPASQEEAAGNALQVFSDSEQTVVDFKNMILQLRESGITNEQIAAIISAYPEVFSGFSFDQATGTFSQK